jgi:hypothetical protein
MKIKNVMLLILTISFSCISLSLVFGAAPQIISPHYDFANNYYNDPALHESDSVMLRVTTDIDTVCYYTENEGVQPGKSFDGNYGTRHEKVLENLDDGIHNYYITCGNNNSVIMNVNFKTIAPISGVITLSQNPPLKEGQYKITLVTSELSIEEPLLQYTFDESNYRTISLKGSGKNWEGYIIIPSGTGEAVGSFIFKGTDLAGRQGTKITGDSMFIVDTINPATIETIDAVGYQGQVKLNWFFEEKVKEFNVYRSENQNIEYTDFYKTTTNHYFTDNDVEKGKTYYYKVAGVDEAGNIGDLSKEIYATALLNNYSQTSGLSPTLVGKVDNSIAEINSVIQDINEISSSIDLKEDKEKNLFTDIKLDKELDGAISELNALKRDVENYKLQDLSETELNAKIASSTLKLNIIKKKVPEDITIVNEKQITRDLNETTIQKAFLQYSSDTQKDYNKEITETLKLVTDNKIEITSNFYDLEIMYMDGTKKDITLIEDNINSNKANLENISFISYVPKEIAAQSSELKIINLDYNIVKDDPVISFSSDTKKIIYYLNKQTTLDSLEGILVAPIKLSDSTTTDSSITGNSILNSATKGSWGIVILVIFALVLIIYFLRLKNESSIKPVLAIIEDIKKSKDLLNGGKETEARELYEKVKEEYKLLPEKEKNLVMKSIKEMNEEISK